MFSGLVARLQQTLLKHTDANILSRKIKYHISPKNSVYSLATQRYQILHTWTRRAYLQPSLVSKTARSTTEKHSANSLQRLLLSRATFGKSRRPRTVVEVHPVEIVLAVVIPTVDRAAHRARNPLHHRHGIKKNLTIAIRERSNLAPHVFHSHGEFRCYRFARPLAADRQRGGTAAPRVSMCVGCFVVAIRGDGALRCTPIEAKSVGGNSGCENTDYAT